MIDNSALCCERWLGSGSFDLGAGAIAFLFAFYGLIAFAIVVPIEAVALRLLRWNSFLRSLFDSFLVNLVTTVIGFLVVTALSLLPAYSLNFLGDLGNPFSIRFWILSWILTVIAETVLLALLHRRRDLIVFGSAFVMNVASYLALAALISVLGRLPG